MFPLGPWPHPRTRLFVYWPGGEAWGRAKVLWAWRAPLGDVLVRGRRLDGGQRLRFTSSMDTEPHRTLALHIVSRRHGGGLPTTTFTPTPGCYAWQIDGHDLTQVIVFKVIARQGPG
jgi:hypothetical protein